MAASLAARLFGGLRRERETPRGKPVASLAHHFALCSSNREPPPGKLVASSESEEGCVNKCLFGVATHKTIGTPGGSECIVLGGVDDP
jgi:hypothetical protein